MLPPKSSHVCAHTCTNTQMCTHGEFYCSLKWGSEMRERDNICSRTEAKLIIKGIAVDSFCTNMWKKCNIPELWICVSKKWTLEKL